MKKVNANRAIDEFEGYPLEFRQAMHLIAGVLLRIKEKRLAKGGEKRLINNRSEGENENENEN